MLDKKRLFIFSLIVALSSFIEAGRLAAQRIEILTPVMLPTPLRGIQPSRHFAEIPPPVATYGSGTSTKYFISTGRSYVTHLRPNRSILTDPDALTDPVLVTQGDFFYGSACREPIPQICSEPPFTNLWSRSYYGVFSAQVLPCPISGECIVAFMHGENKNTTYCGPPGIKGSYCCFRNTMVSGIAYRCPEDFLAEEMYSGFLSITYAPVASEDYMSGDHNLGPIVWPATGYLEASRLTFGLRHPSSVIRDGYIYVYYVEDTILDAGPGRRGGIKVARAQITNWHPGNWRNYFGGSFSESSLPDYFDRAEPMFLYIPGGRSDALFPSLPFGDLPTRIQRFSVSSISGTPFVLGLSWDNYQRMYLRISQDMVHWSEPTSVGSLPWGSCTYPTLINSTLTDTNTIDANNFYILCSNAPQEGNPTPGVIPMAIAITYNGINFDYKNAVSDPDAPQNYLEWEENVHD